MFYNLPRDVKNHQISRIMKQSHERFDHAATVENYLLLYVMMSGLDMLICRRFFEILIPPVTISKGRPAFLHFCFNTPRLDFIPRTGKKSRPVFASKTGWGVLFMPRPILNVFFRLQTDPGHRCKNFALY